MSRSSRRRYFARAGHARGRALRQSFRAAATIALWLGIASASQAQTIDFDSLAAGQVVANLESVGFAHSDPGVDLVVATGEPSTSGANFLGVQASGGVGANGQQLFLPGDVLTLSFDPPVFALGLEVISTPATPFAAFELLTDAGSIVSGTPSGSAGDDEVHSLSMSGATPITRAELRSTTGLFAYHVDDLYRAPVPEPAITLLLSVGASCLALTQGRRRNEREEGPT